MSSRAVAAGELAGREHVDARDLELGRGDRAAIAARLLDQPVGQRAAHVPERRDQAVDLAAMLDAFADREDRRRREVTIWSSTMMPRPTASPAVARQRDVRADADRHHHQARRDHACRPSAARPRPGRRRRSRRCRRRSGSSGRAPPAPVLSSQPAASSSWRSISVGIRWMTVTFMPRRARPCAASSPSRPPPITTASPPLSGRARASCRHRPCRGR